MVWRFERLWCFVYEVSGSTSTLRTLTASIHRPRIVTRPPAFENVRCSLRTLLVKAVTSIAEKFLEKVLTYFCGFR